LMSGKNEWGWRDGAWPGVHLRGKRGGFETERSPGGFLWRLSTAWPQRRRGLAAGGGVHGQRDGDKGMSWGYARSSNLSRQGPW
jgi:hypothetical protein